MRAPVTRRRVPDERRLGHAVVQTTTGRPEEPALDGLVRCNSVHLAQLYATAAY